MWTLLLGVMAALPVQAGSPKISRDLDDTLQAQSAERRVIVTYTAEAPRAKKQPRRLGHVLEGIDAVSDRLTGAEIAALASDPAVVSISPDRRVVGAVDNAVRHRGQLPSRTSASTAWA
jgi:hypothetical protein